MPSRTTFCLVYDVHEKIILLHFEYYYFIKIFKSIIFSLSGFLKFTIYYLNIDLQFYFIIVM